MNLIFSLSFIMFNVYVVHKKLSTGVGVVIVWLWGGVYTLTKYHLINKTTLKPWLVLFAEFLCDLIYSVRVQCVKTFGKGSYSKNYIKRPYAEHVHL